MCSFRQKGKQIMAEAVQLWVEGSLGVILMPGGVHAPVKAEVWAEWPARSGGSRTSDSAQDC